MGFLIADKNKVGWRFESGTYANPTGASLVWPGLIQDSTPDDNPNTVQHRYAGAGTRDVSLHTDGPLDHAGVYSFYPQNWKFLQFVAGSIGTANGSVHTFVATNSCDGNNYTSGEKCPFISFSLEDGQQCNPATGQNFIRTYNGCMVNSMTVSTSQGEPLTAEINYMAKEMIQSSGATTPMTADNTTIPYLWSHSKLNIPNGTIYDTLKSWTWSWNNNIEAPHYCNGSREVSQPYPLNRDHTFEAVFDATAEKAKILYEQYFIGGSEFNAMLDVIKSGSEFLNVAMSGCKLTAMTAPTGKEGINEQTITIVPKTVHPVAVDEVVYIGF